jgi:STE24 endopeptidase
VELICSLTDRALDLVFLALMSLVLAVPLDQWLQEQSPRLAEWWVLRLLTFYVLMTTLHLIVSLPLSYYSGYVLEHRFKLSTLSRVGWFWRYFKVLTLALPFGLMTALALYEIIRVIGPWWWLVAAGAFFLVSVVISQIFPVLIQPLFYTIRRLENPELQQRMARLAAGTGLSIEGVYRIALSEETVKANAQLAGLGRTRRVLLGDTLLYNYTADEIEVILAHEIGHHVFHHIRKLIVLGLVFSAAGFWLADRFLMLWLHAGTGEVDYGSLPIYALPRLLLILAVFRMVLEPLQNAISRHFERQCDQYALQRTGRREAYIQAFQKLAKQNKDDPDPPRLEVLLFHSHPPIRERLAMAESPGT